MQLKSARKETWKREVSIIIPQRTRERAFARDKSQT